MVVVPPKHLARPAVLSRAAACFLLPFPLTPLLKRCMPVESCTFVEFNVRSQGRPSGQEAEARRAPALPVTLTAPGFAPSFPFACVLECGGRGPASDGYVNGAMARLSAICCLSCYPILSLSFPLGAWDKEAVRGQLCGSLAGCRCLIPGKRAPAQTHSPHLKFQNPARAAQQNLLFV